MRIERLVIEAGGQTLTADFHPKLTVVGGLTGPTREALVGEIVDSLAGARPGIHLELEHAGRHLTVFRPTTGRHRVVDTDAVSDVTTSHLGPDGDIDLFAAAGVDRELARRTIRFGREDLVARGESDSWIAELARVDQDQLWKTAMRCRTAEQLLERVSDTAGASPDDAAVVERVEHTHADLVSATESYERVRLIALTIATVGAMGAVGATQTDLGLPSPAFLLLTLVGVALALFFRRSVNRAATAERDVLEAAGADDYSSFHFARVSALLDSDNERRRFMLAVSDHRKAVAAWEALAGSVPLRFALDHETDIRATADLHTGLGSLHTVSTEAPTVDEDVAAELAQAVLARVEAVRALTAGEDCLPLVIDDPFAGLDASLKPMLLEMLSAQAGHPQLILVTADDDVTSWARVEAMTGDVTVVEPTIRHEAMA